MVVPFGSARERRSRTTYRPTVTLEGSTHVDTFTGTTSSFSRTASGKVAVVAVVRQATGLLTAAAATPPGELFTSNGVTMRRSALSSTPGRPHARIWAEDPAPASAVTLPAKRKQRSRHEITPGDPHPIDIASRGTTHAG